MLAIELEAFEPVHPHRDREIEVAQRAVGEPRFDEPAIGPEPLGEPCPHLGDLAAEEAGRVDEVAAMGQHEVAAEVGLGVVRRAFFWRALVAGSGWTASVMV